MITKTGTLLVKVAGERSPWYVPPKEFPTVEEALQHYADSLRSGKFDDFIIGPVQPEVFAELRRHRGNTYQDPRYTIPKSKQSHIMTRRGAYTEPQIRHVIDLLRNLVTNPETRVELSMHTGKPHDMLVAPYKDGKSSFAFITDVAQRLGIHTVYDPDSDDVPKKLK